MKQLSATVVPCVTDWQTKGACYASLKMRFEFNGKKKIGGECNICACHSYRFPLATQTPRMVSNIPLTDIQVSGSPNTWCATSNVMSGLK